MKFNEQQIHTYQNLHGDHFLDNPRNSQFLAILKLNFMFLHSIYFISNGPKMRLFIGRDFDDFKQVNSCFFLLPEPRKN